MRISIMQMACVYEPNAKNSYSRFDVEYVHVSTKTLNFALSLQNILQFTVSSTINLNFLYFPYIFRISLRCNIYHSFSI